MYQQQKFKNFEMMTTKIRKAVVDDFIANTTYKQLNRMFSITTRGSVKKARGSVVGHLLRGECLAYVKKHIDEKVTCVAWKESEALSELLFETKTNDEFRADYIEANQEDIDFRKTNYVKPDKKKKKPELYEYYVDQDTVTITINRKYLVPIMYDHPGILAGIDNPEQEAEDILIDQNHLNIRYIINPTEQTKLRCAAQGGTALKYIKNPTEEMKMVSVQEDGHSIRHCNSPSEVLQIEAIKKDKTIIKLIKKPTDKVVKLQEILWNM